MYCDILYQNSDIVLLEWFERMQSTLIDLLYRDKTSLFEDDLDREDIENLFTPTLKMYKGGRFYTFR